MAKKKENKFISLPLEEQERISKEISRLNVLKCLLLDTIDIYHIEERRLMKENDLVINSEAERLSQVLIQNHKRLLNLNAHIFKGSNKELFATNADRLQEFAEKMFNEFIKE